MDRTEIKRALDLAHTVVISHGITAYLPERYRTALTSPVNDHNDAIMYDFYLYPKKSPWDSDNFTCSLTIAYRPGNNFESYGALLRDYTRDITIRHGSSEVRASDYKVRENFIANLMMLVEVIESITPQATTIVVETSEELKKRLRREHEQLVGGKIHSVLDKKDFKNLRKGGNSRTVRLPESYTSNYGVAPEPGVYTYKHTIRKDRSGRVAAFAVYTFRVLNSGDGGTCVKIFKID